MKNWSHSKLKQSIADLYFQGRVFAWHEKTIYGAWLVSLASQFVSSIAVAVTAIHRLFTIRKKILQINLSQEIYSFYSRYMKQGIFHLVHTENIPKTNISWPLIWISTWVYQRVINASFWESFAYVLNGWSPSSMIHGCI